MVCATALLSGCHIYKAYDRPESIETNGIYRDPIAEAAPLATTDTTNIANLPWQEVMCGHRISISCFEPLGIKVLDKQYAARAIEEWLCFEVENIENAKTLKELI